MSAGNRLLDAGTGAVKDGVRWGLKGLLGLGIAGAAVGVWGAYMVGAATVAGWVVAPLIVGAATMAGGAWIAGIIGAAGAVKGGVTGFVAGRRTREEAPNPEMLMEQQRAAMLREAMMRKQELANVSAQCADPDAKGGFVARQTANTINNNLGTPQPGAPSV